MTGHFLYDDKKKRSGSHASYVTTGGLIGFGTGLLFNNVTNKNRQEQASQFLPALNAKASHLSANITFLEAEKQDLIRKRAIIPPTIVVKKEITEMPQHSSKVEGSTPFVLPQTKRLDNDKTVSTAKSPPGFEPGGKVMSSKDFLEMKYDALNFRDRWGEFFGNPSVTFRCAISGMAGNGKTTFAIQFAKYLALHHGRVIYISSEEGFSKTLKDKLNLDGGSCDNLFIADLKTAEEIRETVKPEDYNFIFIDSLDKMQIDANELNRLREHYTNSALVTISQSTKDGKMRGSYQIVHDSDIEVEVVNMEAITKKNRFNEKDRKFPVMPKTGQTFQGPRNLISK